MDSIFIFCIMLSDIDEVVNEIVDTTVCASGKATIRVLNRFPESFNHDPPTNGGLDCGRFTTSCGSRKRSGGGNCKYANGYAAPCTVDDVFLAGNSFVRGRDFSARLWTFDIGNAPAVTANAGVKVTQGTSTGILKTALSGGITTINRC